MRGGLNTQGGSCCHAAGHFPAGNTEVQGGGLWLHCTGQMRAQVCGLRAKLIPASNSPTPPLPPLLPTSWPPLLVPGLSLEGLAGAQGWAVAGGLNEATLPGNLLG